MFIGYIILEFRQLLWYVLSLICIPSDLYVSLMWKVHNDLVFSRIFRDLSRILKHIEAYVHELNFPI